MILEDTITSPYCSFINSKAIIRPADKGEKLKLPRQNNQDILSTQDCNIVIWQ